MPRRVAEYLTRIGALVNVRFLRMPDSIRPGCGKCDTRLAASQNNLLRKALRRQLLSFAKVTLPSFETVT